MADDFEPVFRCAECDALRDAVSRAEKKASIVERDAVARYARMNWNEARDAHARYRVAAEELKQAHRRLDKHVAGSHRRPA